MKKRKRQDIYTLYQAEATAWEKPKKINRGEKFWKLSVFFILATGVIFVFNNFDLVAIQLKEWKERPEWERFLADKDGDGMLDWWEESFGLSPYRSKDAQEDDDQDGLANREEFQAQTDPLNFDSDKDGYADGEERMKGFDPNGLAGAEDDDGDGLPNWWEKMNGLDPQKGADGRADFDGDGRSNKEEYQAKTNPLAKEGTSLEKN